MASVPSPLGRYCSHCGAAFQSALLLCPRDGHPITELHADPLLGQVVAGRYRVVSLLGGGGMGRVYRVEHVVVGKPFALKVLHGDFAGEQLAVERFLREAQVLSQLSHPHIVAIVDFGESDTGLVYLVTELVSGQSLFDRGPLLSLRESVHVVRQIARALVHAHQHGIVHRDLKPENIMLVKDDEDSLVVKILDFGIARVAPHASEGQERLTSAGVMMGTPAYMSPEQARGHDVDGRADLYALGVILYELLAGCLPFEADNPIDYVTQHLTKAPPSVPLARAPRALADVALRLLQKEPEGRFADASELLAALDGATRMGATPASTKPPLARDAALGRQATMSAAQAASLGVEATVAAPILPPAVRPSEAPKAAEPAAPKDEPGVPAWREGQIIEKRWEVFGGTRGANGQVVYVRDRAWDGLPLAMKAVGSPRASQEAREREEAFRTAAAFWRDLGEHPQLVAGYYTLEVMGALRFFLEYVPGKPMSLGQTPLSRAFDLMTQLALALELVHARGAAHGGLVPSRCLVLADDTLRLTPHLGNPVVGEEDRYVAPEHRRGGAASPAGDVYALGGILDRMLREGAGAASEPLSDLCRACLAEKATDRPSAQEVVLALGDLAMRVTRWRTSRPLAPREPTELSENRRAAAYHTMGEIDPAKAILDACLSGKARKPLSFINRKVIAVNAGEVDAAALPEALREHGEGHESEAYVRTFRARLEAHVLAPGGMVHAVAFSPDGTLVLTGSEKMDESARLWHTGTGKLAQVFRWSRDRTLSVCFHPGGTQVVTGSDWGAVRLWNAGNGQQVRTMNENWGRVTQVAFSPDGKLVLVGCRDGSARCWDTSRGEQVLSFKAHAAIVTSVAFSPDGHFLLTGGGDAGARLWEAGTGKARAEFGGHATRVNAVTFSPDGKFVVTGSADATARLWAVASGKAVLVLKGHQGQVTSVSYSPKGDVVATGSADGTARLWEIPSGEPFRTLIGHSGPVTSVALSPSGALVVTGSEDETARLWGVKAPRRPKPAWSMVVGPARAVHATPGEEGPEILLQRLRAKDLSAYAPLTVTLRRAPPSAKLVEWVQAREAACRSLGARAGLHAALPLWGKNTGASVLALAVDALGERLLVASSRDVQLRDLATGRFVSGFPYEMQVRLAACSGDGRYAATCGALDRWDLWGIREEKRVGLCHARSPIRALALSVDGKLALSGHEDGVARVWDTRSRSIVCELAGHEKGVTAVAFDAQGKLWLTGSEDHTARLWDARDQRLLHTLVGHTGTVRALAMSRDGEFVATGTDDHSVRLWEPLGGALLCVLVHQHEVTSLALDLDTRFVCTASDERAARVWDRTNGRFVSVTGQGKARNVVAVGPGGVVVASGQDGLVEAWAPDSDWVFVDDMLSQAEALAGGGTASTIWPHAGAEGNLDAWLDVWRDLRQASERTLTEEQAARLLGVQRALGDALSHLVRKRPALLEHITRLDPLLEKHLTTGGVELTAMATLSGDVGAETKPHGAGAPRKAVRGWRHLSLSVLGLAPGVALLAAGGPVGLAVGALAIAGGLWQGVAFAKTLRKEP